MAGAVDMTVGGFIKSNSVGLIRSELNSLREGQVAGEVDGASLAAHVILPRVASACASTSGVLLAAKCAADLGATRAGVHVGNAAITARGTQEFLPFAKIIGENRRSQTLGDIVVRGDRFLKISLWNQVK